MGTSSEHVQKISAHYLLKRLSYGRWRIGLEKEKKKKIPNNNNKKKKKKKIQKVIPRESYDFVEDSKKDIM